MEKSVEADLSSDATKDGPVAADEDSNSQELATGALVVDDEENALPKKSSSGHSSSRKKSKRSKSSKKKHDKHENKKISKAENSTGLVNDDETDVSPQIDGEEPDVDAETTANPTAGEALSIETQKTSHRNIFGIFGYKKDEAVMPTGVENDKKTDSDNAAAENEAETAAEVEPGMTESKNAEKTEPAESSSTKQNFWSNFVGNKIAKTKSEDSGSALGEADNAKPTSQENAEDDDKEKAHDDIKKALNGDAPKVAKQGRPKSPGRLRFWSRKTPKPDDEEGQDDTKKGEIPNTSDDQDEGADSDQEEIEVEQSLNDWILSVKERHEHLALFEKERHQSFLSQWTALQAYVQVYDTIGSESIAEMQRLAIFVDGIWTAQKRFAEIMQEKKRQMLISKGGTSETKSRGKSNMSTESSYETQNIPWTHIVGDKEKQNLKDGESSLTGSSRHEALGLDDLSDRWAMASDDPPTSFSADSLPILPSKLTPLLDAMEVSHDVWESKFSDNSQQTRRGIVNVLNSTWPPKIRSLKAELDNLCEEIFPTIVSKQSSIQEAWEKYETAVQAVLQAAVDHRKSQNSLRHMFSRSSKTVADAQLALSRSLSDKTDVWIAEQTYHSAVHELKTLWENRVIGKVGIIKEIPGEKRVDVSATDEKEVDSEDPVDSSELAPQSEALEDQKDFHILIDPIAGNEDEEEEIRTSVPAIREILQRMAETEARRRVAVAESLKDWVTGQERLLVGSETATGLAWMEAKKTANTHEDDSSSDKAADATDRLENSLAEQSKSFDYAETNLFQSITEPSQAELQHRRTQVQKEVEKALSEKWTTDLARDWVHGASRPEETLHLMEEVFGLDTYLDSPHVVSAAVGEWWKVERPQTSTLSSDYTFVGNEDEPERHIALVVISSGPQMHIYNLNTAVVVLDLETPPHDALLELLSGNTFPAPTLSIPLADAQVQMTDEVDILEVVPTTPTSQVPCIRLLCPHLNNIY